MRGAHPAGGREDAVENVRAQFMDDLGDPREIIPLLASQILKWTQ